MLCRSYSDDAESNVDSFGWEIQNELATKALNIAISNLFLNKNGLQTDLLNMVVQNTKYVIEHVSIQQILNKNTELNVEPITVTTNDQIKIRENDIQIIQHKIGEGKTASVHFEKYQLIPVAIKELRGRLTEK
eukprot:55616_1